MQSVIDRAIQMHGAGGLTEDYCMAEGYNYARWCRQADGPDQVHQMALGKQIIERYSGEKAWLVLLEKGCGNFNFGLALVTVKKICIG